MNDNHPTPRLQSADLIYYWNHCWYCGEEMILDYKIRTAKSLTKDHIIPRCKGGKLTIPACHECNDLKGNLLLEEFRIVFFGGHLGVFAGEKREQELIANGVELPAHWRYKEEPLRNLAIQRAFEQYLKKREVK